MSDPFLDTITAITMNQIQIPEGYVLVTEGRAAMGDKVWDDQRAGWVPVVNDTGRLNNVRNLPAVIRKAGDSRVPF